MYYPTRVTTFPNVANAEYSLLAIMHVDPNFVVYFQNYWQMLPKDLIFSIAFTLACEVGVTSGTEPDHVSFAGTKCFFLPKVPIP